MAVSKEGQAGTPTIEDLSTRIHKTNEEVYNRMIMIYGAPGTGKTHLLGTALEAKKRILVLDTDIEGRETLEQLPVDAVSINSQYEFEEFMNYLIHEKHKDFDIVAVDTISSLQVTIMEDLEAAGQGADVWRRADLAKKIIVTKLRELRKKDVMILLTAHEQRKFRRGAGTSEPVLDEVYPKLFPSVWEGLNYHCSAVGRLINGDGEDVISTLDFRKRPIFVTKDRTGRMPRTIDNPTIGNLYTALENN